MAARGGTPDPALVFSLRWLRDHIPDYGGPPVFVQGDTGPGNFMYLGGRVTAVVDWELAHLGDPMDDIAWLSLRATQEPFTGLPDAAARVRGAVRQCDRRGPGALLPGDGGDQAPGDESPRSRGSDEDAAGGGGGGGGGGGNDVGNGFIYQVLHRRLWLEALASANGLELTPAETPQARDPRDSDWMYDAVLTQLRDVIVPRTTDPLAQARGKGSPASSSTWLESIRTAPTTRTANCRTWRRCLAGAPTRC